MTSAMEFNHHPLTAQMIGRRPAWHARMALGQHTQSDDVGCAMPSSHLGSTYGRTILGVACHHCHWATHTVRRHQA